MQKLLVALLAIIVLAVLTRLAISYFSSSRIATGLIKDADGTATLSPCNGSLNCVSSTSSDSKNKIDPFEFIGSAESAFKEYSSVVAAQPGTQIVTQSDEYLHATFKTKLLGYVDDVELLLSNDTIHVRSASRLGKSDLGANRKRVETLRGLITNKP